MSSRLGRLGWASSMAALHVPADRAFPRPLASAGSSTSGSPTTLEAVRSGHPRRPYISVPSAGHYHALREALAAGAFGEREGVHWPTVELARGDSTGHAQLRP